MSGQNTGGYQTTCSVDPDTKERSHAGTAYLAPAIREGRENLEVVTGAMIDKVLFSTGEGGMSTASGVRFWHNGVVHELHASGEVIICGGSISSPCILEI